MVTTKIIGIIGYGRFGKFLTDILLRLKSDNFNVIVFSNSADIPPHIQRYPIEKINSADIIIPCVPISAFEETILNISNSLKPGSVVMDICSVKMYPIEVMQRTLPSSIQILGTHPIFGPDSFSKLGTLNGLPIVVTKVRCNDDLYQEIINIFNSLELKILEMTAEEHDRYAAYSQAYAFLIGKISQKMNLQSTPIDTLWFKLLLEQKNAIEHDSEQLFKDIQTKNPFSIEMRNHFSKTVNDILKEI